VIRLVVFDLDGTLAESKAAVDEETAKLLSALLDVVEVAVISGGDWPQFEKQLVARLPDDDHLADLSLLPTCGTKFYAYRAGWQQLYSEDLTDAEKTKIIAALKAAADATGLEAGRTWGEVIEDRGSQITFSALGQQAPIEEKKRWDPDFAKRQAMRVALGVSIPEFSVRLGGTTSIDITKPGIDKAYGIAKLRDTLGIALFEMLFIGDALFPGGNDYPAKQAGVVSIQVTDPNATKQVIETILACADGVRRPGSPKVEG